MKTRLTGRWAARQRVRFDFPVCALTLVLLMFACGSSPRQSELLMPSTTENRDRAEQVLDESERLSRQVLWTSQENTYYHVELCRISAEINSPQAERRCLEAYQLAAQLRDCEGEKRQVKSLIHLSTANPVRALNLLDKVFPWCERLGDPHAGENPDDPLGEK
jgi:hypothetical protein